MHCADFVDVVNNRQACAANGVTFFKGIVFAVTAATQEQAA